MAVRFCTNTDSIAPPPSPTTWPGGFATTEEELVSPVAVAERLFASASS